MTIMKRASVFMILAQALIHFRPNPSYEKYFRFLAGIMTIVILVIPVMELLQEGAAGRYDEYLSHYMERLQEISSQEPDGETDDPSQAYVHTMENEIKTRLNNYEFQDGYQVKNVEIKGILTDGESCRLKIQMVSGDNSVPEVRIERIRLREAEPEEDGGQEKKGRKEDVLSQLRLELAELLETDEENVEVEIIE